jgi:putative FmdB family regulatory protein
MPIYEYKCLECGTHFEKLQKSTDQPLEVCEKCNGRLEKQWSLSGFQFKGAGWYVTDYAKDKTGKPAEKSEDGGKTSDSKSTVGTETASNKPSDTTTDSKKETVSKKE